MHEQVTELQKFESKHGQALSRFTNTLLKLTSGAIIGSVVTAGVMTGAIEPAKFFKAPEFIRANTAISDDPAAVAPTIKTVGNLNYADEAPLVQPHTANTDDLLKSPSTALHVLELDASNEVTFNLINRRANEELDAINIIRKAVDQGEGFSDDMIKGSAKADAILAALDLARVASNPGAVRYDEYVFEVAKGLPKTTTFTDIVETLNWKRETVRTAIDLTTKMAWAMRQEDNETADVLFVELSNLMDNYEMATQVEKITEKLVDALESHVEDSSDPTLTVPGARDVSAGPLDRLRGHLGAASSASSISMKL